MNENELCERLKKMLPHGSGINYNWYVWHKRDKFYASNMYDAMESERGFYCHVYNFTATYKYNGQNAFTPCHICDGKGIRYIDDFHKYHESMTRDALINWLFSERDIDVHDNSWFYCALCEGSGKLPLHEFALIRVNVHGQKEYSCCGYDLKDYLYQTLDI